MAVFLEFYLNHKTQVFFCLLFVIFISLRFYELFERANVGWDQADSAWAARSILLENPIRLEGVPIKGNAGMFMGPLYYYLITPFYFFTNLDMIASPIFASVVSVFSFLAFYNITKKLFDANVALLASFIFTFSVFLISYDRLQAAFVLIPIISYVVFYFLYKIITGNEKYILFLAAIIGFGFHVHFTSVFYLIIVLLTIPFFPRNKKSLIYGSFALLIFLIFLSPMLYSVFFAKSSGSNGIVAYLNSSYHGLHLRRFLQLTYDGFISFELIMQFHILRILSPFILPLFIVIYFFTGSKKMRKKRLFLSYLMILFVLVPWLVFSTYTGELTDYYFSHSRYIAIVTIAYLLMQLYKSKVLLVKFLVISLLVFFAGDNVYKFSYARGNYPGIKQAVKTAIESKQKIKFVDRDPFFYTYHVYTVDRKK